MTGKRMQIQTKRRRKKKDLSSNTAPLVSSLFIPVRPVRIHLSSGAASPSGHSVLTAESHSWSFREKSLCAEGRKEEERITPRARTNTWRRLTTQEVASPGGDSPDRTLFPSARQRTDDKRKGMSPLLPVQTIKIKRRHCTGRHEVLCGSCKNVSYFGMITSIYVYNY